MCYVSVSVHDCGVHKLIASGFQSWGQPLLPAPAYHLFFSNSFVSALVVAVENWTTSNSGPLGSCINEERSKLWYLVWIAEFSESSSFWMQMALSVSPGTCLSEHSVKLCSAILRERGAVVWGVVCVWRPLKWERPSCPCSFYHPTSHLVAEE